MEEDTEEVDLVQRTRIDTRKAKEDIEVIVVTEEEVVQQKPRNVNNYKVREKE
jgi:hypothetical protein